MLRNFFAREDRSVEGQTLVEYALIIALVAVMLVAALAALQVDIAEIFGRIGTELDAAGA